MDNIIKQLQLYLDERIFISDKERDEPYIDDYEQGLRNGIYDTYAEIKGLLNKMLEESN